MMISLQPSGIVSIVSTALFISIPLVVLLLILTTLKYTTDRLNLNRFNYRFKSSVPSSYDCHCCRLSAWLMALKRKASFSAIVSPKAPTTASEDLLMIDETPRHLNSRTRKRFRDNRPNDEIVYENTLRWLYSAQQQHQQQQQSTPPVDEDMNYDMDTEFLPPPETIDPRQQTLHKFFQPTRSSSFRTKSSNQTTATTKETGVSSTENPVMPFRTPDMNAAFNSVASDTSSSNSPATDDGVNCRMDIVTT